jgi:hypothetical protein
LLNYRKLSNAIRVVSKKRPSEAPKGYNGWPLWYHRQCLIHNKSFGWLYIAALLIAALVASTPFYRYEFIRIVLAH